MVLPCDHTSVGILVHQNGRLLLIERKKPPFGMAPPSGHVDDRESFKAAAISELKEEVGLDAIKLDLVGSGVRDNHCRRPGGTWHRWEIYRAETRGEAHANRAEAKRILWCNSARLYRLAKRTQDYRIGRISADAWENQPGLEPVWLDWLVELGELTGDFKLSELK